MESKTCESCGASFSRPVYKSGKSSLKQWNKQRFCSLSCASRANQSLAWKKNPKRILPTGENHHGVKARMARMAQTEPKTCDWCKKSFFPNEKTKWSEWRKKRFCSLSCSATFYGQNYPTGKNHPQWKGGKSSLNEKIRKLPKYIEIRSNVFQRDKYTCQKCGISGVYLNADHIRPLSVLIVENNLKTLKDAKNCNVLWDLNNLRTLCLPCHTMTETYGRRIVGMMHRTLTSG